MTSQFRCVFWIVASIIYVAAFESSGEEGSGGSGDIPYYTEGSGENKEVDVIFYPGYDGRVVYNFYRENKEETEEDAASGEEDGSGVEDKKCVLGQKCFGDDDCNGGTCIGLALGKCNCAGCLSLLPCKDDSACGGLIGACNNQTNLCDCDLGFKNNGVKSYLDALFTVCNVKDCTPNTDSCYGLPCNSGICACL